MSDETKYPEAGLTDDDIRAMTIGESKMDGYRAVAAYALRKAAADPTGDDECDALRRTMADILTRTANALRGDPGPRHGWGWSDLPSRAAAAVAAAKSAKKSANPPDAYAVYVRDEMMNRPFCTYEEAVEWARKNIANGSNQPHHIRTLHAALTPLAEVPGWLSQSAQ